MPSDTAGGDNELYRPMYCPECDEKVPERWDTYDETFVCPECGSLSYEDKGEYIEVLHGTVRWQRENGYEITA